MSQDSFGLDLRLVWPGEKDTPPAATANGHPHELENEANLAQALLMRLLVDRGELAALSHPPYGSRIHELIGEPMDRANLNLLGRLVREALRADPRVREVVRVVVQPRPSEPGVLDIQAEVRAGENTEVDLELRFDGR